MNIHNYTCSIARTTGNVIARKGNKQLVVELPSGKVTFNNGVPDYTVDAIKRRYK